MLPAATAPTRRSLLRVALAGSGRTTVTACNNTDRKLGTTPAAAAARAAAAAAASINNDSNNGNNSLTSTALSSSNGGSGGACVGSASLLSSSTHTTALFGRHAVNSSGAGSSSCSGGGGGESSSTWSFAGAAAAAAAAAVVMVLYSQLQLQRQREGEGEEEGVCLCKGKASATDSLQDYARRLQRLRSVRDIFKEYASINADDVGQLMTCGDFLRAMLCYKYVRVDGRELKRRCARYINPLLGDDHGLISFIEFCFLLNLLSIPAGLFDVAFAAADADGSGTIDVEELERLVKRLAPPAEDGDGDGVEGAGAGGGGGGTDGEDKGKEKDKVKQTKLTGHKRLSEAWFGKGGEGDGKASRGVPREQFSAFVRDLRMDVKTVECRLYSRSTHFNQEEEKVPTTSRGWLSWIGLGGGSGGSGGDRSGGSPSSSRPDVGSGGGGGEGGEGGEGGTIAGWWSRYEHETISMADLALTLVSTCHPRDMPVYLTRVQAIQKKRKQIPLKDALLLHEVLEDHAQDLDDALGMYSKASSGGAVGMADFARAAKVISGKELSNECVWLVFKMFDRGGNGRLEHDELIQATHQRLRRLPGQRESPSAVARFVQCVRGD